MKCATNVVLNHKNEMINCRDELHNYRDELLNYMNEIKIKHDYFSILEENEREYVTTIGAICLTSILPFKYFELILTLSKPNLNTYHPSKF